MKRPMTKKQLRDAAERLGVSQARLAESTGYSLRAVQDWMAGKYPVPPAAAKLLRLALWLGLSLDQLDQVTDSPSPPSLEALRQPAIDAAAARLVAAVE